MSAIGFLGRLVAGLAFLPLVVFTLWWAVSLSPLWKPLPRQDMSNSMLLIEKGGGPMIATAILGTCLIVCSIILRRRGGER